MTEQVYLYQNYVHILPRAQTPAQMTSLPSGVPEVVDAVEAVRAFSTTSKAHPKIQDVIRKRIGKYVLE